MAKPSSSLVEGSKLWRREQAGCGRDEAIRVMATFFNRPVVRAPPDSLFVALSFSLGLFLSHKPGTRQSARGQLLTRLG